MITVFLLTDPVTRPPCRFIKSSASSLSKLASHQNSIKNTTYKPEKNNLPSWIKDIHFSSRTSTTTVSYLSSVPDITKVKPAKQSGAPSGTS